MVTHRYLTATVRPLHHSQTTSLSVTLEFFPGMTKLINRTLHRCFPFIYVLLYLSALNTAVIQSASYYSALISHTEHD